VNSGDNFRRYRAAGANLSRLDMQLEDFDMTVKRMTPIYLADDMVAAERYYCGLGLEPRETDEPECVGYFNAANTSGVIVIGSRHAEQTMPRAAVDVLRRKGGLYVWVDAIDRCKVAGHVLGEAVTTYGTRERYIGTETALTVLSEKLDQFIPMPRNT
jgi:hypothetical protein